MSISESDRKEFRTVEKNEKTDVNFAKKQGIQKHDSYRVTKLSKRMETFCPKIVYVVEKCFCFCYNIQWLICF